jgi:hypothetical protein
MTTRSTLRAFWKWLTTAPSEREAQRQKENLGFGALRNEPDSSYAIRAYDSPCKPSNPIKPKTTEPDLAEQVLTLLHKWDDFDVDREVLNLFPELAHSYLNGLGELKRFEAVLELMGAQHRSELADLREDARLAMVDHGKDHDALIIRIIKVLGHPITFPAKEHFSALPLILVKRYNVETGIVTYDIEEAK